MRSLFRLTLKLLVSTLHVSVLHPPPQHPPTDYPQKMPQYTQLTYICMLCTGGGSRGVPRVPWGGRVPRGGGAGGGGGAKGRCMILTKMTLENMSDVPQICSGTLRIAPRALNFQNFLGGGPPNPPTWRIGGEPLHQLCCQYSW